MGCLKIAVNYHRENIVNQLFFTNNNFLIFVFMGIFIAIYFLWTAKLDYARKMYSMDIFAVIYLGEFFFLAINPRKNKLENMSYYKTPFYSLGVTFTVS